ncbi:hypothetical protein [Bartonella rattimassiliensis]|uniref:Lipoprotein n=1 Tax=Bartonella rattimassiliensis 15908 TaxID=1094556 RepID=J0QVU2_9HYPH|nr:hypothetical protein [Bartonella rattimassiliensis]EJF87274.1 hypothetical protein MCY_00398 [Bartonella rattimassiliensis 15908]
MKQILKLLSGIALFVMAGCALEQPSQTAVDAWEKFGADQIEIKKALLECGIQHLDGRFDPEKSADERFNAEESVNACMIQAGFQDKLGRVKWCEKYENLPICQPDAVIPQRSVERRLNSLHCEEHKKQPECQP